MEYLKKAFLLWVGAMTIAYDEATKALKQQQTKLNERFNRKAA